MQNIIILFIGSFFSFIAIQAQYLEETQQLLASEIETDDGFGYAIDSSNNFLVISAAKDDDYGEESGAVYLYTNNSGVWEEYTKLTAVNAQENDYFGYDVAISGDYIFVSSPIKNNYSGSVHIFQNISGTWTEIGEITASDAADFDVFGYSVSVYGEYAIIGAYGDDDNGDESGSAYIFYNNAGTWEELIKLTASDAAEYNFFAKSVDIFGNYIIVGADENSNNGVATGSVYIYHNNSGNWEEVQKIVSADAVLGDHFGSSVSIYEDKLSVGAKHKNGTATWSGAAYVFNNNSGIWEQEAKVTASDAGQYKYFGISVSILNDKLVVGSKGEIIFNPNTQGAAHIFTNSSGSWVEAAKLISSDIGVKDYYGFEVKIIDGFTFVGAPFNDTVGEDAGSAYVYDNLFLSNPDLSTNNEMVIYPVPTSKYLNIKSETNCTKIEIFNSIGQIVLSKNVSLNTNRINISNLKKGLYFCRTESDSGLISVKKFLKD